MSAITQLRGATKSAKHGIYVKLVHIFLAEMITQNTAYIILKFVDATS